MKQFVFSTILALPLGAQQMRNMQMPGDMQHPAPNNTPAQRETQSMRNSEAQQQINVKLKTPPPTDTRNTQQLQEPENPSAQTGDNTTIPYFLADVEQRTPITLDQWQQWAQANNPTLKQAQAAQQRSLGQARQAALLPNPTVGYSGDHIRGGSYGGGEQGAFVQQTIVLGGKLGARRDVYTQQAAADAITLEAQTIRIRADVSRAFYTALAAQSIAATRKQLLTTAQQASDTAHHLANLGQLDAPDILQAEIEADQASIDLNEAQRDYLAAFAQLAALAGQPDTPPAPLTGNLEAPPNLDTTAAVRALLADSPQIKLAQQQAAVATAAFTAAKREPIPNLTLQAGEWHSGEQLNGTNKPAGWMSFAQAGIELPLWNRNQGATAAAAASVSSADANITRTQLQLKHTAEPIAQQYLAARYTAEHYRDQLLPRAQRAVELTTLKYNSMALPYPQVLTAQRTLLQLRIAYTHALAQQWQAVIALQTFTLRDALDSPASNGQSE